MEPVRALLVGDAPVMAEAAAALSGARGGSIEVVRDADLAAGLARGDRDERFDVIAVVHGAGAGEPAASERALRAAFAGAVIVAVAPDESRGALIARLVVAEVERAAAVRRACDVEQVLALMGGAPPSGRAAGVGEAEERASLLWTILEVLPDFVTHVDLDGRVRYTNRPVVGNGRPATVGMPFLELVAPENRDLAAALLASVFATGAPEEVETRAEHVDGSIMINAHHVVPIVVEGLVTGAIVVTRDVTREKHTEAQLIRADRISSVGALAAGVAHEINNPLAVVIANLDLALRRMQDADAAAVPEIVLEELRDAAGCADTVRQIVGDLEVFARSDDERLGPVDVHRVVESVLRLAWSEVRHRARIERAFGDVPPVLATQHRLGQLLLNLVVNAAQSIEEGHYADNTIRVATSTDEAGRVVIAIRDTGAGIPPALRQRIFAPFSTTRPHGQSVGLGLTICKRIVASLGGELAFTSEVGVGSEFTVRLPAAPVAAEERIGRDVSPAPGGRGRVLIVDDDARVARTITRVLADRHDTVAVSSGQAALARIAAGERFDAILCDLMMPQMTGMDFMRAIEQSAPAQAERVVFVTGGTFTPRARAFLESERYRRIEKPFRPQVLRAVVEEVIGGRASGWRGKE